MNKTTITIVVTAVSALALLFLTWFFMSISYTNREAELRSLYTNSLYKNEAGYDAMWKIINQTSQVPKQYSQDFKDAYTSMLSAGNGTDGSSAMKNLFAVASGMNPPKLDSSLYRKVQDVIESERTKFLNAQNDVLAIKNEHDILRTTFPGKLFVGNVKPLPKVIVTSTKTNEAFQTGRDDDVELFKK